MSNELRQTIKQLIKPFQDKMKDDELDQKVMSLTFKDCPKPMFYVLIISRRGFLCMSPEEFGEFIQNSLTTAKELTSKMQKYINIFLA